MNKFSREVSIEILVGLFMFVVLIALSRVRLAGIIPVRRILQGVCAMYACLMVYEVYLIVVAASALPV